MSATAAFLGGMLKVVKIQVSRRDGGVEGWIVYVFVLHGSGPCMNVDRGGREDIGCVALRATCDETGEKCFLLCLLF